MISYIARVRLKKKLLTSLAGWAWLSMLFVTPAWASDDLLIYSDYTNILYGTVTYHNGWKDNGGMPRYQTNNPVHSGVRAICLSPSAGSQGLKIVHDDLDTSIYAGLSLWLNGGDAGGQIVTLSGLLDNVEQTRVPLGKLPTNAWTNVTVSLAALGLANKTNLSGLRIGSYTGSVQPPFFVDDVSLLAAPTPAVVKVGVLATQTVRTIDPRMFGINATAWDGNLDKTNTLAVLTNLHNYVLRWPGGSWGDQYHWTNENWMTGAASARNWGSFSSNFMHLATNTHAQGYIICNYGSSTPEEAAFGVRMFNVTNHCNFKYWEIGNEIYGASWEVDNNTNAPWRPHDPWTYAMRWTNYYAQMKAVDPTIKIGAVVTDSETASANYTDHPAYNARTGVTNYGWTPVLLATLKEIGGQPDFLINHDYSPVLGDTGQLLYGKQWPASAARLRQMLNDYFGPGSTNVELCVTETGGYGDDISRSSLVSGLFYADGLGQILQTEFNSRLWWDLRNGQGAITNSDPALYGWRTNAAGYYYRDEGIITAGAEPTNCYPTYYCAKLMTYFAGGGDTVLTVTNDSILLGTYAVKRTNGTLTLMVINKSSASNITASIGINGYRPATNALVYSYGISQDTAARTGSGSLDIATSTFEGAGANFSYTFPPYSVSVLALTNALPTLGTNLQYSATNGSFVLRWPTNYVGWLVQSNALTLSNSNSWFTVPGSDQTNLEVIHLGPALPKKVFYRMLRP